MYNAIDMGQHENITELKKLNEKHQKQLIIVHRMGWLVQANSYQVYIL